MLSITVICVGKLKERFYLDAAAEYMKRLGAYCRAEIVELSETKLPAEPSISEITAALAKEAALIEQKIPKGAYVTAMCVEGDMLSSEALAERMNKLTVEGHSSLVFLIGGSEGLDTELKRRSALRLSMSRMTFPHHLARVMLLEQLYRAFKINEGSRYHK